MASGAPLLNKYKRDFLKKRLPQTILGGPKLYLGYGAPVYIYLNQVFIFSMPWILGGIFTAVTEVGKVPWYITVYIYGPTMVLYVLAVQCVSWYFQAKRATISPLGVNPRVNVLAEDDERATISPLGVNPRVNVLAEDDEIEFTGCFAKETFEFIVPVKKHKVNILLHALLSGLMCGMALRYLLPSSLNKLYGSAAATVVMYIIGWLTVCVAQYPLAVCAPPETAAFRSSDAWETDSLTRWFYACLCFVFQWIPGMHLTDSVLHVVFVCLPAMWLIGLLPPLDALFLWIGEQCVVVLFGGSPMSSSLRLVVMLLLSTTVFLASYYIPSKLAVTLVQVATGYILSTDILSVIHQTLKPSPFKNADKKPGRGGVLLKYAIFHGHLWVFLAVAAMAGCVQHFLVNEETITRNTTNDLVRFIGYGVLALTVLQKTMSDLQKVYVGFGLFRNLLYPKNAHKSTDFRRGLSRLNVIGFLRRTMLDEVSPVVMVLYLVLVFRDEPSSPTIVVIFSVFGSQRAFRAIWQSTADSMTDVSTFHISTLLSLPPAWQTLPTPLQLLLISVIRERSFQFLNKLYFFLITLVMSQVDKKQRHKSVIPTIALTVIFSPVILAFLLVAAILSAPILPLFTLPIFLIGFPRPVRFWPSSVGASSNKNGDTVYYEYLSSRLAEKIGVMIGRGTLGNVNPGDQYLIRYQDRLVWLLILERGVKYVAVSIKGLELQETSCHTVEAARIDDILESTFEQPVRTSRCSFNPHPFNILTPCGAVPVNTYSDAKNVLTGIIDSPDTLKLATKDFVRALVWVLLKGAAVKRNSAKSRPSTTKVIEVKPALKMTEERTKQTQTMNQSWGSLSSIESEMFEMFVPQVNAKTRQKTSMTSLGESIWSEDQDQLLMMEALESTNEKRKGDVTQTKDSAYISTNESPVKSTSTRVKSVGIGGLQINDDADDIDQILDDLGMPSVDVVHHPKQVVNKQHGERVHSAKTRVQNQNGFGAITNLAGSMQFSSPYSSRLSLPLKWREIPVDQSRLRPLMAQFSRDWFDHVLCLLKFDIEGVNDDDVSREINCDETLVGMYAQLVVACHAVVNVLGVTGGDPTMLGPSHAYKVYMGDIPWSPALDWLKSDEELMYMVIKAYRYALKLAIDQALLGEATSAAEFQEYFEDYDRDYYIGCQTDQEWRDAVLAGKDNLFSLGFDPPSGVYSSRLLTRQDIIVYVSRLNSEAVKGQWANQSLELLYLTNDDEERYSIQAHPTILRNLVVQSADPPLGYPIFSSEPINVATVHCCC